VDSPDQTQPYGPDISPLHAAPGQIPPNSGPPPFVPYGSPPHDPTRLPQHPLRISELLLAIGVIATAFLPWFTLRYSMIAVSAQLVDVPDLSNGPPAWLYLLELGFMTALIATVVGVARRQSRAAAVAEMAGFGLILAGVLLALSGGMTSGWLLGMSNTEGFRIEAGVGLWTCLAFADFGLALASIHLIRPNFMQPVRRSVAAHSSAPYGYAYQAPVSPAWPAPPPAWPVWPAPPVALLPTPPVDMAAPPGAVAPAQDGPAGQMVTLESGRSTMFVIAPGQRVLIGRGPGADLIIYDARVSPVHALIERRGPGWLVTGLDANNPTWILDPTGRAHPVSSELGLRSGTLLVGGCQVLLYPPQA